FRCCCLGLCARMNRNRRCNRWFASLGTSRLWPGSGNRLRGGTRFTRVAFCPSPESNPKSLAFELKLGKVVFAYQLNEFAQLIHVYRRIRGGGFGTTTAS